MKSKILLALLSLLMLFSTATHAQSKPNYYDAREWREATKNPNTRVMLDQLLAMYDKLAVISKVNAKFYISSSNSLNAFATQNTSGEAIIIVTIGAVSALSEDQDAMAALLAHEFGHVAKGHVTSSENTNNALSIIGSLASAFINYKLGTRGVDLGSTASNVTGFAAGLVGRKFGRDLEREADQLALEWMTAAGYSASGSVRLEKMLMQGDDKGESSLFSTHPGGQERIDTAERFIAETPAALALKDRPMIAFGTPSASEPTAVAARSAETNVATAAATVTVNATATTAAPVTSAATAPVVAVAAATAATTAATTARPTEVAVAARAVPETKTMVAMVAANTTRSSDTVVTASRKPAPIDFLQNPDRACNWFGETGMRALVAWSPQTRADNSGYVCQYVSTAPDKDGILVYGRASIDAKKQEAYISVAAQAFKRKRKAGVAPNEIVTQGDMENFATRDETRDTLLAFAAEIMKAQGKEISAPMIELISKDAPKKLQYENTVLEYDSETTWKVQRMLSVSMTVPAIGARHKEMLASLAAAAVAGQGEAKKE
jgi:Zn-dependent protease with chaperone function